MTEQLEWYQDYEIGQHLESVKDEIEHIKYADAIQKLPQLLRDLKDTQNYCWVPYPVRCLATVPGRGGEWHIHCMLSFEDGEEIVNVAWVEKHYY